MVNLEPYENEFVLSYKQEFEPNYRSIQQGDDTDYDEDLVEFGGRKRRRTRRNKTRRNKSKIRKSRKHRKSRRH